MFEPHCNTRPGLGPGLIKAPSQFRVPTNHKHVFKLTLDSTACRQCSILTLGVLVFPCLHTCRFASHWLIWLDPMPIRFGLRTWSDKGCTTNPLPFCPVAQSQSQHSRAWWISFGPCRPNLFLCLGNKLRHHCITNEPMVALGTPLSVDDVHHHTDPSHVPKIRCSCLCNTLPT